jgi:putative nucleotidyltransferase with HDIG domain
VALRTQNLRRLLLTFEALADLGPTLTSDCDFPSTARTMLNAVLEAVGTREGALFAFSDRPAMLRSLALQGFAYAEQAVIPLLPRHQHALTHARGPQVFSDKLKSDTFLSSNGNIAPELFRCVLPLRVAGKLVGVIGLGRAGDSDYDEDSLDALSLISNYVALAIHNHELTESLERRVSENLRLLASVHNFYDHALEAFATAIDIKHVNIHGHSLRVGKYAAAIGQTLGLEAPDVSGLRAAGYLHDIGKVAVDKRLFGKPDKLDPEEMREMADHTTVGHRIVQGVQFPWPQIPDVVRWHHERADGTGYPDRLHLEEMPLTARIIAMCDAFDAMTTDRPWRSCMTVGEALADLVRQTPQKFDANVMQALLIQVRRDAVDSARNSFLDERVDCSIAPADVDHLASSLSFRLNSGRLYLT